MKKFRNYTNFKLTNKDKEKPSGASLTIQGESRSIKELLINQAQGIMPGVAPVYYQDTEDYDSPDYMEVQRMDLVELEELQRKNIEMFEKYRELLDKKQEEDEVLPDKSKNEEVISEGEPEGTPAGNKVDGPKPEGETK